MSNGKTYRGTTRLRVSWPPDRVVGCENGDLAMTTGRAIDHVVLAVTDLDRAAETYQGLGFTLTPRARHEDRMGTSNRLAQFAAQNFIELLEVDRPQKLARH